MDWALPAVVRLTEGSESSLAKNVTQDLYQASAKCPSKARLLCSRNNPKRPTPRSFSYKCHISESPESKFGTYIKLRFMCESTLLNPRTDVRQIGSEDKACGSRGSCYL